MDDSSVERITATSSRTKREEWIRWKYVDKRFVRRMVMSPDTKANDTQCSDEQTYDLTQRESLNRSLFESVADQDLIRVHRCLAVGADVNWQNSDACDATCLHLSVQGPVVELSEFLLLNGAKIDMRDTSGRTAIHLAIHKGIRG